MDSGGGEEEVEEWSSEDAEAELTGRKRRKGGKTHGLGRSRHRKTAAVGDLEAAAEEAEAAVAELAPKAEAWKEKYTVLVKENEALKKRVEELMLQRNQGAVPPQLTAPLAATAVAVPSSAPAGVSIAKAPSLELLGIPMPPENGDRDALPVVLPSFGSPLPVEHQQFSPAGAGGGVQKLPPELPQQK